MKNLVTAYLEKFKKERRMRMRLVSVLVLLAIVVGTGVYWQLRMTGSALTNEVFCGKEEHTHDDSCYELVLVCGLEESEGVAGHTHTDACYEEQPNWSAARRKPQRSKAIRIPTPAMRNRPS